MFRSFNRNRSVLAAPASPVCVTPLQAEEKGGSLMGKYLPVIKTAECGPLTRAAHVLGYTQPSLGYIINNIEDELGIKLFYRDQRGVTLTEAGAELLEIMKKIEATEELLRETARASAGGLLRVRIFSSVTSVSLRSIMPSTPIRGLLSAATEMTGMLYGFSSN